MINKTQNFPRTSSNSSRTRKSFKFFFNLLFKQGVEEMLMGELENHLGYERHSRDGHNSGNSRNVSYTKKVKTESLGELVLNIPRNRNGDFNPQLIPMGSRMSDKLEKAIIGMYSRGMTTSDISDQVKETYDVDVSEGPISNVTNRIFEHVKK